MKKVFLGLSVLLLAYLLLWPVEVEPVAWQAPRDNGFSGDFSQNAVLADLDMMSLGKESGPEDIVVGNDGLIYVSVHSGAILRIEPESKVIETFANTGGRPLGLKIGNNGELLVADAYRGILKINADGNIDTLLNSIDGQALVYANNLDVSRSGVIFFSEASSKFGAEANGGSYPASLIDLLEHGGHGRLFAFNPQNGDIRVLVEGLNFANGVALSHDEQSVLVAETGAYRVNRHWLVGEKQGQTEVLIDNLPGFPDNMTRGLDGKYWLGFASPRNALVDGLSDKPFLRKVVHRLPNAIKPQATAYSHVIAFDDDGNIVHNLQDPDGRYPVTTGVTETATKLYVSSLMAEELAWLKWPN